MDFKRGISQIAFIFLIFVVISSGYVSNILSCQMQNMLKYNCSSYYWNSDGICIYYVRRRMGF